MTRKELRLLAQQVVRRLLPHNTPSVRQGKALESFSHLEIRLVELDGSHYPGIDGKFIDRVALPDLTNEDWKKFEHLLLKASRYRRVSPYDGYVEGSVWY
ncbi:MAG: hypothetical protein IKP28_02255 [Clostridia bacterium]|nr:hypothetical protein [Clostridia bacterium]